MNVLVVDDDEDTSALIALLLEREGWSVTCVPSLRDARAELERDVHSVLVTDVHLPDGLGSQLLVDGRPAGLHLAIVVTGTHADHIDARGAGFDVWLSKPIAGPVLVSTIRERGAGVRSRETP